MDKKDAKIFLLEDLLHQAQWQIQFMNKYFHPAGDIFIIENNEKELMNKMHEMAPCPMTCKHVEIQEGCPACKYHLNRQRKLVEAIEVLSDDDGSK